MRQRLAVLAVLIAGIVIMLLSMSACLKAHQSNLNDIMNNQPPVNPEIYNVKDIWERVGE